MEETEETIVEESPQNLESTVESLAQDATSLAEMVTVFFTRLTSPIALYQLLILIGILAVTFLLRYFLRPIIRNHLANAGYQQSTLRIFVTSKQN